MYQRITARERRFSRRHNREAEMILDAYGHSVAYLHATDCVTFRSLMRGESLSRQGYWSLTRSAKGNLAAIHPMKRKQFIQRTNELGDIH